MLDQNFDCPPDLADQKVDNNGAAKTRSQKKIKFIDLFAGAGGLSEGFIAEGFQPIAHVEVDKAAAFTLKTRSAFHALISNGKSNKYRSYLKGKITRDELYAEAQQYVSDTVINLEINDENISTIFSLIDASLESNNIDLIIGGPPCQAYSIVGRSRSENKMLGDQRNYLFEYYAKFLTYYSPKYFVFENVVGLLSARDQNNCLYLDKMIKLFSEAGYDTEYRVVSADKYGVLQKRRRVILIGKKSGSSNFFPELPIINTKSTVADAFADLPPINAGEGCDGPVLNLGKSSNWLRKSGVKDIKFPVTWHQSRPHNTQDLEIYKRVVNAWDKHQKRLDYNELPKSLKSHRNRSSFLDRFKVVASNLPSSHTVVAHISKDGHYYIHPDINQNRSLTPREAARLQTFPDNYYFESASGRPSRTAAFKQIGNAVPVLLARTIAKALKEQWT
jgi:DNA (cytosine-5)-methyltransferase 1